jgi:hypothetical protein
MSARIDLYNYISTGGLKMYSTEELRKVGKISDWARVLRQLKQDGVIDYDNSSAGYNITRISNYTSIKVRSGLNSKDKYRIRNRDGHRCQSCGKGVNDGVKLHIDHKIPIDWGGGNDDSNLWTLCDECNLAKKSFFKDDFDAETMKLVYNQSNGYQRLKVLFENSPNKKFNPSILQGIAGIRDWTRTIRDIRDKYNLNICWFPKDEENPNGYYACITE